MYASRLPRRRSWDVVYPTSIFEQDFGHDCQQNEFDRHGGHRELQMQPLDYEGKILRSLLEQESDGHGWNALRRALKGSQGISSNNNDKSKFTVNMDCSHFKPDEINVTVDDDKNQLV